MIDASSSKTKEKRSARLSARAVPQGQKQGLCRWRENEGEMKVYLDKLNLDLDIEITTKSKLRALKIA